MTGNNYTVQSEPDHKGRSYNWRTAIGLQQVDGLTPSKYLIETANYNDFKNNIKATPEYLNKFFDNLLLSGSHELRNRELRLG